MFSEATAELSISLTPEKQVVQPEVFPPLFAPLKPVSSGLSGVHMHLLVHAFHTFLSIIPTLGIKCLEQRLSFKRSGTNQKTRTVRAALRLCLSVACLDSQALFTEVHIGIFRQCCACCGMPLKWPTM